MERAGFEQDIESVSSFDSEIDRWVNGATSTTPEQPVPPPAVVAGANSMQIAPPAVVQPVLAQRVRLVYGNCTTTATLDKALAVRVADPRFEIHIGKNNNRTKAGAFPDHYAFLSVPVCSSCFGLCIWVTTLKNNCLVARIHSIYCSNRLEEVDTNVFVVYHTNSASFPGLRVVNSSHTNMEPLTTSWVFCLARGDKSRPFHTSNDYCIACLCPASDKVSFRCVYKP